MHPEIERLLELDKIDREIARLKAEIAALPQRVAAIEKKLASTQAQVDSAHAAVKKAEGDRRKFEADIQALQAKISKYRDQTINVKTNQEYKALLDEISFAEAEIRKFEDRILDGMVEIESREGELKVANKELAAERAEIVKEQDEARARTAEDQAALAALNPRREELRTAIDDGTLRHYERLLKLRGSALAEVRDGKCGACQLALRPQTYNDVLSGETLLTCDSCSRYLWMPASAPTPGGSDAASSPDAAL